MLVSEELGSLNEPNTKRTQFCSGLLVVLTQSLHQKLQFLRDLRFVLDQFFLDAV